MAVGLSPYLFVAALSFIDAVLIVVMFGGDIVAVGSVAGGTTGAVWAGTWDG